MKYHRTSRRGSIAATQLLEGEPTEGLQEDDEIEDGFKGFFYDDDASWLYPAPSFPEVVSAAPMEGLGSKSTHGRVEDDTQEELSQGAHGGVGTPTQGKKDGRKIWNALRHTMHRAGPQCQALEQNDSDDEDIGIIELEDDEGRGAHALGAQSMHSPALRASTDSSVPGETGENMHESPARFDPLSAKNMHGRVEDSGSNPSSSHRRSRSSDDGLAADAKIGDKLYSSAALRKKKSRDDASSPKKSSSSHRRSRARSSDGGSEHRRSRGSRKSSHPSPQEDATTLKEAERGQRERSDSAGSDENIPAGMQAPRQPIRRRSNSLQRTNTEPESKTKQKTNQDLPPETKAPRRAMRGRSSSSRKLQSSNSKEKLSVPPETQSPRHRTRSKSSRGQGRSHGSRSKSSDKSDTNLPPETQSPKRRMRGKSSSARHLGSSSEHKSPHKSKSSRGVPPETQSPRRPMRGRSASARRNLSSRSSSDHKSRYKSSHDLPPETQSPRRPIRSRSGGVTRSDSKSSKDHPSSEKKESSQRKSRGRSSKPRKVTSGNSTDSTQTPDSHDDSPNSARDRSPSVQRENKTKEAFAAFNIDIDIGSGVWEKM